MDYWMQDGIVMRFLLNNHKHINIMRRLTAAGVSSSLNSSSAATIVGTFIVICDKEDQVALQDVKIANTK